MSASRLVTIFCDGERNGVICGEWEYVGHDARDARAEAKAGGWLVGQPDGKDYCRACRAVATGGGRDG